MLELGWTSVSLVSHKTWSWPGSDWQSYKALAWKLLSACRWISLSVVQVFRCLDVNLISCFVFHRHFHQCYIKFHQIANTWADNREALPCKNWCFLHIVQTPLTSLPTLVLHNHLNETDMATPNMTDHLFSFRSEAIFMSDSISLF